MSIFNKKLLEQIEAEKSDEEQHAILILVVDDEVHTRHTLKDMLSQYYRVITADDGQTALELINNHPAPEEIHLILCDQRMPKVNGVDFLEKTLDIIPDAVRIVLTAYTDMEAVVDAINRAQIHKFLLKPFDKNELLLTIQRALETYDLKRQNKELIKQLQNSNTILEQEVIHKTKYLNQEKDYSEMLFELAGMIMVVIRTDQTVKKINRKGCEILGYAKSEIIGRNWFDHFVPSNLRQEIRRVFHQLVSENMEALEFYENTILNNKGEERLISWHNTMLRDENDQIIGTLSSGEDITERKQMEQSLYESEARFKALHNASFGGIAIHDKGLILECNQGLSEMTGYSVFELIGMEGMLLVAEISRDYVMNNILSGYEKPYEAVGLRKNGEEYPIRLEARNIPYKGKNVRVVEFRDITERKRAEEALKENEEQFRSMFENHHAIMLLIDPETGKIIRANQGAKKFYGYSAKEFENLTIQQINLLSKEEIAHEMANAKSEKRNYFHFPHKLASGEIRDVEVHSSPISFKGKTILFSIIHDITERRWIEIALRESEDRLKKILEILPVGVWVSDKNGVIKYGNPAGQKIWEGAKYVGPEEFHEYKAWRFSTKEPLTPDEWGVTRAVRKGYVSNEEELEIECFDGTHKIILNWAIPIFGINQEIMGAVAVNQDITDRKRAEIKQQELEAMNLRLKKAESLGHMAGGIAHLFNNYLHVASGNLEMALENLSDDSLIHENLTQTMKAVRRCSDVSGSMLHYLGHNLAQITPINTSEFCQKNLPSFQSLVNSNITIEINFIDTELIILANANQMQRVLNHLITNACESIGENKGRISLTTKTIPESDISKFHLFPVGYKPSADKYACVEISDTGCGISEDDFHKISDPFFTTKFTGRGLGLAVVSGIVKSWGGCIGVRSKVGHGSSFMVFIPLSKDNSIKQSQKLAQSLQPQQKEFSTVLLVDDNAAVLKMTTIMLNKMGFEVISALNGVEAVEKFRQHKESISCLITDLSMPKLDGWGTLAEIRKIKPAIPAVLASGYDEAFAMSSDASEKPQAFLHKPYTMKDLKRVLEQSLGVAF